MSVSQPPALRPRSKVNIAHYPPAVTWGPRVMRDFELVWILSGSARWTVEVPADASRAAEHHEIELTPGTISLSRKGMVESYAWDPDRHSTHAWVHFDIPDPEALAPLRTWPLTRDMRDNEPLGGLCAYLVTLAGLEGEEAHARSEEILRLLVDVFVRGPLPGPGPRICAPVTAAAMEYVRRRWEDRGVRIIPLRDIAAAVNVSVGHLSREFHKEFRTGMSGALELVRLGLAAVSLQRTNMTLEQVARGAGFSNAYHLSRRFSAAYGVPPGRYRRLGGEADPLAPVERAGLTEIWAATVGRSAWR